MKRHRILIQSFHAKVTLLIVAALFFVMCLSNFLIYRFSINALFQQLREEMMMVAKLVSLTVDAGTLSAVPMNRQGANSENYKIIARQLERMKESNARIKYIYTLAKTGQEGVWQFIVDPNPEEAGKHKDLATSYPGDRYNARRFSEMLRGFEEPSADKKLETDEWGATLSGYAPIRDKNGKSVALLGVDMSAGDVYLAEKAVQKRAILVLLLGILVSVSLGLVLSTRITYRIEKLVDATRHLASENLDYQVEVRGHDEITELARSFNIMAASLAASRQKLRDYFYRVVQSLIKILEEKDPYTQGHSERVAGYAHQIAVSMGFNAEKAELIRRAAALHDIGKLVIQQEILNKKEELTEEEWNIIRRHPVIGTEILKPVLLDEEMLAMVRCHHERYDGTGYPDKIKGDNINIFAQIVSVADSYDAMTSPRAYRLALSKEEAVEELKRNCGTQFNFQIVKVFLKAIESKG